MPATVDIQVQVSGADAARSKIAAVGDTIKGLPTTTATSMEATKQGFWQAELAATNFQRTLTTLGKGALFAVIGGGIASVVRSAKELSNETNELYANLGRPMPRGWLEGSQRFFENWTTGWKMILGKDNGAPPDLAPLAPTAEQTAQVFARADRATIEGLVAGDKAATDPVEMTLKWAESLGKVENRAELVKQKYREITAEQEQLKAGEKDAESLSRVKGGKAEVLGSQEYLSGRHEIDFQQQQTELAKQHLAKLSEISSKLQSANIAVFSMN